VPVGCAFWQNAARSAQGAKPMRIKASTGPRRRRQCVGEDIQARSRELESQGEEGSIPAHRASRTPRQPLDGAADTLEGITPRNPFALPDGTGERPLSSRNADGVCENTAGKPVAIADLGRRWRCLGGCLPTKIVMPQLYVGWGLWPVVNAAISYLQRWRPKLLCKGGDCISREEDGPVRQQSFRRPCRNYRMRLDDAQSRS